MNWLYGEFATEQQAEKIAGEFSAQKWDIHFDTRPLRPIFEFDCMSPHCIDVQCIVLDLAFTLISFLWGLVVSDADGNGQWVRRLFAHEWETVACVY